MIFWKTDYNFYRYYATNRQILCHMQRLLDEFFTSSVKFCSSPVSRRRMVELGAQSPLLSLPVLKNSRGESHFFTKFVSNQRILY